MKNLLSTALASWIVLVVSCSPPNLTPVTYQMDWTHEAEFTGLYAAQDQGFFREAGLEVTLVEGPAGTDVPGVLTSGGADVAQMGMTMFLNARKTNPDLVAVMATYQTSPRVLMTRSEQNIRSPRDLEGLRVGIKSASWRDLVHRVMTNAGADPTTIVEVPVTPAEVGRFYHGEVDVWTGFANSEPVEAQLAGQAVSLLFADDFGAGGYDELVVVRRSSDRVLRQFVQALARGWAWAAAHGEQVPGLLDPREPQRSTEFHRLAWQALRPLVVTGKNPIGWIEMARWPTTPDAFTMELLEARP